MSEDMSLQNFKTCANVGSNFRSLNEIEEAELLARPSDVGLMPTGIPIVLPSISSLENITQDFSNREDAMSIYIQRKRSQTARDLKQSNRLAFLILDTVADYAKRKNSDDSHPLLEIGEALITASLCNVSPQEFETGLNFLVREGQIEIIHRGRRDLKSKILPRIKPETLAEKSRIRTRINGTVVKLISTSVYDINCEEAPNHIPNQTRNTCRKTPTNQEYKNIRKKEESISNDIDSESDDSFLHPAGNKFSETARQHNINYQDEAAQDTKSKKSKKQFKKKDLTKEEKIFLGYILHEDTVMLKPEEHARLIEKHGDKKTREIIQILDSFKLASGKEYASDYGCLKNGGWVLSKWEKDQLVINKYTPQAVDRRIRDDNGKVQEFPCVGLRL